MLANALDSGAWMSSGEMGAITHPKSSAFEPATVNATNPGDRTKSCTKSIPSKEKLNFMRNIEAL